MKTIKIDYRTKTPAQRNFHIATNFVAPIDIEALTVRRKGKVIKGETDIAIAVAVKERNEVRNALKRQRKARRSE